MAILLESKVVRIAVNAGSYGGFTDQLTRGAVQFPKADLRIEAGFFIGAVNTALQLVDLSNWVSATCTLKAMGAGDTAPAGSAPSLAQVVVPAAQLTTSMTAEQWAALTHAHAAFDFSEAEVNALPAKTWCVFTALLTSGKVVPLQFGPVLVVEDGYGIADPAAVVDGTAFTKAEALALFEPTYNHITARTGGGAAALDGLVTVGQITTGTSVRTRSGPLGGREEWWLDNLAEGEIAEDPDGGLVFPDDHHPATNNRGWRQIL